MAETLPGANDSHVDHEMTYPDPLNGQFGPYPALHASTRAGPSSVNGYGITSRSEAEERYDVLANDLNRLIEPAAATGPEGLPIANSFLNLHPQLMQHGWPDESQAEETDIDGFETADELLQPVQVEPEPSRGSTRERGRGRGRGRGGGRGRRGYKWALVGTAHDPKLNREPVEKPRGRPRGGARGRRKKALDPGRDFKEKQVKATKALLDGDYESALENARAAVQANPEIWPAHSLLAEALQALGRDEDSLAALLSGAVVARDAGTWMMVGERTLEFAGEHRSEEVLQQALFCYSQAIDLEKHPDRNVPARIAKLDLWIELNEYTKARRDCKQLLAIVPGDIELARQLAGLAAMTGDVYEIAAARKAYENAMDASYPTTTGVKEEDLDIAWNHLNILMELVDRVSPPPEAAVVLKTWARRFLGRADELFWTSLPDDDREFDNDDSRRNQLENWSDLSRHDPSLYGEGLPLELRIKLGLYRLKSSSAHREEAMRHFSSLMAYQDDIASLHDMFYIVAVALQSKGEHESALEFFEPILSLIEEVTDEFWLQYGRCLVSNKRFREGADCFEQVVALNPAQIDARVELARLYQDELKEYEKAFRIVDEIIALNRKEVLRRENLLARPKTRTRPPEPQVSDSSDAYSDEEQADPEDEVVADVPVGRSKKRKTKKSDGVAAAAAKAEAMAKRKEAAEARKAEKLARREEKKALRAQQRTEVMEQRAQLRSARKDARIRSRAAMESMADQVNEQFDVVRRLWPAKDAGDDEALEEWAEAAFALYEAFRGVKQFYPTRDKHIKFRGFERLDAGEAKFMNEMESWRKQLETQQAGRISANDKDFDEMYRVPSAPDENLPKDFCGIPFVDWHHVFVDLALLHARRADQPACYEIIDDGLYGANVFYHDAELLNTTQATSMSCALIFNDSERVCFAARWFINKSDFRHGSGFQLFSAANRLSYGANSWFSAGPTQKHMLRTVKALDYHAFDPDTRTRFDWSMQGPGLKNRVGRIGEATGLLDAHALLTYGHMVGVANHSQSALPYFFRAFALQPDNATVVLSIAVMYVQNAMKRQTDNRQYGIAQGISFLQRYQEIRGANKNPTIQQEVAFNTGRLWHMLGLTHLAVASYEKVLSLSTSVQQDFQLEHPEVEYAAEDFSREAALALMNILAIAGNDRAAEHVAETYLVL